ncbi:MAG: hypothetical protein ACJ8DI_08225 [Ktedonobacteraceae bacterium]
MLFKEDYLYFKSLATARQYRLDATKKRAEQAFGVIVVTASEAAIAYLETNITIVLVGDAASERR